VNATRCAAAADAVGDPLEATAPPAERWILVEHTGPWGRRALSDSGIDPTAARALVRWAETSAGRVTLIRRPDSGRDPGARRCWYLVDSRPGHESVCGGSFTGERELLDVVAGSAPDEALAEPIYLVCTHGKHDACCAVRGRPVAAALAAQYPGRTWECSHLGGDRFAANLVVLPHGFYYGQVTPNAAVELARCHDRGRVEPRWLRGRSSLPAAVQAAQHHARLRTGDHRTGSFLPQGVEAAGRGQCLVRLSGPDGAGLSVRLRERTVLTGRPLTCSAPGPGSFRTFDLVEFASG